MFRRRQLTTRTLQRNAITRGLKDIKDVAFKIPCGGSWHKIGFSKKGHMYLADHLPNQLAAEAVGEALSGEPICPCLCAKRSWKDPSLPTGKNGPSYRLHSIRASKHHVRQLNLKDRLLQKIEVPATLFQNTVMAELEYSGVIRQLSDLLPAGEELTIDVAVSRQLPVEERTGRDALSLYWQEPDFKTYPHYLLAIMSFRWYSHVYKGGWSRCVPGWFVLGSESTTYRVTGDIEERLKVCRVTVIGGAPKLETGIAMFWKGKGAWQMAWLSYDGDVPASNVARNELEWKRMQANLAKLTNTGADACL